MDRVAALRRLRQAAERLVPLPDALWEAFAAGLQCKTFGRGESIVRAGEPLQSFYFVVEGLVRFYYVTPDGKEFNKAFFREDEFLGVFSADIDEPCPFFVEALEPTRAVAMPRRLLNDFARRYPEAQQLSRLQAERVAKLKTQREAALLTESAETRYLRFCADHPDLARRLSQRHIASYIGVTDVALSRIARRLRDETR